MEELELIEAILDYFDEDSLFDDTQFKSSLLGLIILLLLEFLENYYQKLFEFLQKNENIKKEFGEKLLEQAKTIEREISDIYADAEIIREKAAELFYEYSKKAAEFSELENEFGLSFDNSNGNWSERDISEIIKMARTVKNEKSIKNFASMIGHHSKSKPDSVKLEERDAYRGRIGELRLSDDIGAVVPSERALLKNPLTKKLFMAKFAQKQLLSFTYKNTISTPVSKGKGPVIICLDTSGSMQGAPETIAKMLTFAISTIAFKEKRSVYVISFSCEIETMELLWNKKGNAVQELARFLRGGFYGGTDVEPALEHSINLMKESDWENADVLTISDFQIGNMSERMRSEMRSIQENGTRFFSLLIGDSGNDNAMMCFDENYKCKDSLRNVVIEKI